MKRVFLHIGTHKTGTTSVQHFAVNNEKKLHEHGILYPKAGRPHLEVNKGHHLLAWAPTKSMVGSSLWGEFSEDPRSVWDALREEINASSCRTVLISSEEFDVLDERGVETIAQSLDGFKVTIICYLRRLHEFVQALYTTNVIFHGEKRPIKEYLRGMRTTTNYEELVSRWKKVFGQHNVDVNFYIPDALMERDVVVDLFDKLGFDASSISAQAQKRRENANELPDHVIRVVRFLNSLEVSRDTTQLFIKIARMTYADSKRSEYKLLSKSVANELLAVSLQQIERIDGVELPPEIRSLVSDLGGHFYSDNEQGHERADLEDVNRCLEDIAQLIRKSRNDLTKANTQV